MIENSVSMRSKSRQWLSVSLYLEFIGQPQTSPSQVSLISTWNNFHSDHTCTLGNGTDGWRISIVDRMHRFVVWYALATDRIIPKRMQFHLRLRTPSVWRRTDCLVWHWNDLKYPYSNSISLIEMQNIVRAFPTNVKLSILVIFFCMINLNSAGI